MTWVTDYASLRATIVYLKSPMQEQPTGKHIPVILKNNQPIPRN